MTDNEILEADYNLISSIMNGNLNSVKKHIGKCDIKKIGILALRQSLGWEDLEIAQYLIKKGAPISNTLYHSSHDGVGFEIDRLLQLKNFTITELAQACGISIIKGHTEIINKFFKHAPDLKKNGQYFYNLAINNNPEILPFLIENQYCQIKGNLITIQGSKLLH